MIELLAKCLIPNRDRVDAPEVRQAYAILCGVVGVCLNVLLFAGKLAAGILSGSVAITADAFNNLSDAGSSVVSMLGFKLAGQKPDSDHPFGHGRMEYVSGLNVAMLIILMGVELLRTSVEQILHPEAVEFSLVSVGILAVSILVKLYMCAYNRSIGKKIRSASMVATATDSLSDVCATAVVLAATIFSRFSDLPIDGWCGLLVALFILYAGYRAAADTINPLLGQPPEPEFVAEVERRVLAHPEIVGIHDLIVHNYGPGRLMITLHAEVPADGDMLELHDVVDTVEHELAVALHCQTTIHMDPVVNDEATVEMKKQVEELVRQIDERITIHDFRMVRGKSHTNLIFDALVPFGLPQSDREVAKRIRALVQGMKGNYFAVVQVEKGYV